MGRLTLILLIESRDEILLKGGRLWRPRFLISIINANGRISQVKPADFGRTEVNLGHHLENLTDKAYWTPLPSQHTPVVNPWSKTRSNPTWTPTSANVFQNFCRVLQISPKHFKIYLYESCPVCWGTQLSCRLAFQILSGIWWKTWSTASISCSPEHGSIQSLAVICSKSVEKNTIRPLWKR
jgi:hypothetical protein